MIEYVSAYRLTRSPGTEKFGPKLMSFSELRKHAPGTVIGCIKQDPETTAFVYHSFAKATLVPLSQSNLQTLTDRIRYRNACQARQDIEAKKTKAKAPRRNSP